MIKSYKIINLGVLGNRRNGYEVNDAHYTGLTVDLADNANLLDIKRALYKAGFCTRGIFQAKMEVLDNESTIYLALTGTRYGHKPFCELEAICKQ